MHTMKVESKHLTKITVSCDLSLLQGTYILPYRGWQAYMILQVISVKKHIHDVGMKVYLHTYNNEKRERDRFIKNNKKKSLVSNPQPSAW